MRKLSCKWPLRFTLIGFLGPAFYLFFRIGKTEAFSLAEFVQMLLGVTLISIVVWLVYGIVCLLASSRSVSIDGQKVLKGCGNCKFSEEITQKSSDDIPDSEERKCQLTGYNYEAIYTCSKWKQG